MADSINSKAKEYYDNDDSGGSLNSNLKDFLVQQGATGKSINTLWRDYAYGEGGTSLNTRLRNLWGTSGSLMKRWKDTLGLTWDEVKAFFNFRDIEPDFLLDGSTSFDGSNDYIDTGSTFQSTFRDSFTISAWVKFDDGNPSGQTAIVGNRNSSGEDACIFAIDTGGKLYAQYKSDGDNKYAISNSAIFSNGATQWTHCMAVVDNSASQIYLYVNGSVITLDGTSDGDISSITMGDFTIVDNLYIGARNENGTANMLLDGSLANVGIWNRALSASEIESIYWRGSYSELQNTELTNLVSWYDLDSTELVGSNLITNGDMEADSSWSTSSSASTNERSTEQVYAGTYSRKFVPTSTSDGIQSATITTEISTYTVSFWAYLTNGTELYYAVRRGDAGGWATEVDATGLTTNAWNYLTTTYTDTTGGSSGYMRITSGPTTSGNFYIDEVSLKKVQSSDSAGSNNGTIVGATTNTDSYSGESPFKPRIQDKATPKMAVQLADGSTSFDGVDDRIEIASNSSFTFGTGNFTVSHWIYVASESDVVTNTGLVSAYDTDGWFTELKPVSAYNYGFYDGSNHQDSGVTIKYGKWVHFAVTREGTGSNQTKMYIDGSLVHSWTSNDNHANNNKMWFGNINYDDYPTDYRFKGKMANVAIYKGTALTQSQVQELMFTEKYSGLSADLKTNLVSWYDLGSIELGTSLITGDSSDMDTVGNWATGSWSSGVGVSLTSVSGGQDGNAMQLDSTSGRGYARYNSNSGLAVENGRSYRFSIWGKNGEGEGAVSLGNAKAGSNYQSYYNFTSSDGIVFISDFQTNDTDLHISLIQQTGGSSVLFDNVTVKPINVADSHGSNTGEVYGAATNTGYTYSPHGVVDPLNYGEVYSGRALSFDGTNDYVDTGSAFQSTFRGSHSVSCWIKPTDGQPSSQGRFFGSKNSSVEDWQYFSLDTNGKVTYVFESNNNSAFAQTDEAVFANGTVGWAHIVAVLDSTTEGVGGIKVYVNGELASSGGDTTSVVFSDYTSTDEVFIGAQDNNGSPADFYSGLINGLKVFNSALTQAQIQELYTKPETVLPTGVSASNLKLDLPMQEGSGDYVYDGSGNQNHGTKSGATWATGEEYGYQASLVRSNTPMIFDGSDDTVTISHASNLTFTSGFSISAWVNINTTNVAVGVIEKGKYFLRPWSDGNIYFGWYDSSNTVSNQAYASYSSGSWFHVVGVYNSSDTKNYLYINGSEVNVTSANSITPATDTGSLRIGSRPSGTPTSFLNGLINDVAIWDVALDADAVSALYNSGTPLLPTSDSGNYDNSDSLVGYWRNDSNTTWTDRANTGVASFDGTDDRISISDSSSLDITGDLTLSIWAKNTSSSISSDQFLFAKYLVTGNQRSYNLYFNSDGKIQQDICSDGTSSNIGGQRTDSAISNTNQWHHYVSVYDSSAQTIKIYDNGSEISSSAYATVPSSIHSGTSSLDIGRFNTGSMYWNGQISSANVFNTALTATEVSELYAIDKRSSISGHSQFSNCVGSWLMGAGTGDTTSTIQDQSTANNDGTISGVDLIGYNDGTASGSPVSILIPEGSTEGRDSQGYYLSDTTLTSNNGLRMYGGGEVIKFDDSKLFHLGTKDFTFEFWAKFNETSTTRGFFNYFKDTNNRFHLSNYSNIDFYANVGGSDQTTQISNTRDLDWHHYVITKESNTMKIYIDSSVVKTNTSWTQNINFTGGTFYIGVRTDDGSNLTDYNVDGSIDEFRIYHKALSSSEVSKNYTNGLGKHS
jgi:hypothetical protein|tara:strand:+ start:42 stop:5300 length:5259 start_codon:yes stop_codon:yes gene_type:complete